MPQIIHTNVMALNTQRSLNRTQTSMQTALERLSSGLRINRAKDDAAGLAISERFTSQIRGLNQAIRNANDAISFTQTAEGGLEEISNALQRMRELAIQSANGTYSSANRVSLDTEFQELAAEIGRIAANTDFNGVRVLDTTATFDMQVGWEANQTITIAGIDVNTGNVATAVGSDVLTAGTSQTAIGNIDLALQDVSSHRATFGAKQNRFESAVRNMENIAENQSAARSRLRDADFAKETAELTRTQILQQAGVAMLAQANQLPQSVLQLLG
jgi:flagellin